MRISDVEEGMGVEVVPSGAQLAATAPPRYRTITDKELTLVLHSGLEVRLGDAGDLRLKLAVARRLLLIQGAETVASYVDVSVPERPVMGA